MKSADPQVLDDVRAALGRTAIPQQIPQPPAIDESFVRLVQSDADLVAIWMKVAAGNQIDAESAIADELPGKIAQYLVSRGAKRVGFTNCGLFEAIDLPDALKIADIDARSSADLTLDAVYDLDAGITDAHAAVAEVGGIVIRGAPRHPRCLSLIPPIHVCVIKRGQIVPDLIDLFAKLGDKGTGNGTVIITGPSKTADIEMTMVTGVHGPGIVKVFILDE